MDRISFLLLLLYSIAGFSQERKSSPVIHFIGGGIQQVAHSNYESGHTYSYLIYRNPCYSAFYKAMFRTEDKVFITAGLRESYRSGTCNFGDEGRAGGTDTHVSFSVLKSDINLGFAHLLGERSGLIMNYSFYFGINSITGGNGTRYSYSLYGNNVETYNPQQFLTKTYFGVSCEIIQEVRVYKKNLLFFGLNLQVESKESNSTTIGKVANLIIGYKFGETVSLLN